MSKITIQGHLVEVAEPYKEGHVLSANEADALNQLQHENIRNNCAAKIKRQQEETKKELTAEEVQALVTAYESEYEFGVRTGASRDPVEREMLSIAEDKVRQAIKAKGLPLKSFDRKKIRELADNYLAGPAGETIRAHATSVVAAREKLADEINVSL